MFAQLKKISFVSRLFVLVLCISFYLHAGICQVRLEQRGRNLFVHFGVAPGAKLIEESISVSGDGIASAPGNVIPSVPSQEYGRICTTSFTLKYKIEKEALRITVCYQGCDETTCYLPQEEIYELNSNGIQQLAGEESSAEASLFYRSASGYMSAEEFCAWAAGEAAEQNILQRVFDRFGLLLVFLLLIPLGFMLNLTPCILPMIPINLALIGAGENVPRYERVLRGFIYGAGISIAYGTLGIATVLTGCQFGALSASTGFNIAMALVFILLGLSMFGLFDIDFTRFRKSSNICGCAGVFIAGCLSAILSGACVAPVLIWALLLATSLYSEGNFLALLMPYALGCGMALPWPLAAAGIAHLPRPGAWMMKIRRAFALLILLYALYCGYCAFLSMRTPEIGYSDYAAAWEKARAEQRTLLIVFRGRVCQACDKMEKTTFRDARVQELMAEWICVTIDADDVKNANLLVKYAVKGVPTYILAEP